MSSLAGCKRFYFLNRLLKLSLSLKTYFNLFLAIFLALISLLNEANSTTITSINGPSSFIYQGRVTDLNNQPVSAVIGVKFQILDEGSQCVLFEEVHSDIDLSQTDGWIRLAIGKGSRTEGVVKANLLGDIFNNALLNPTFTPIPSICLNGSTSYTPVNLSGRKLRVIIWNGSVEDQMSPDEDILSYPYALVADSLQGIDKSKILLADEVSGTQLTQANLKDLFVGQNYTHLQSILSGKFISSDGTNGAKLPVLSSQPPAPVTGNIWFDSVTNKLKYYDGAIKTLDVEGSGISSLNGLYNVNQTIVTDNINLKITTSGVTHTVAWQGVLSLARGGTGANLSPINGGIVYSTGTALAITSTGTAGQVLTSSGAGTPSWQNIPSDNAKVSKTGDIMIGSLSLPVDGLYVGSGQLVASGNNVGIGTTTPNSKLDVRGAVSISDSISQSSNIFLDKGDILATGHLGSGSNPSNPVAAVIVPTGYVGCTPSGSVPNSDLRGQVVINASPVSINDCQITFGQAFKNPPTCVISVVYTSLTGLNVVVDAPDKTKIIIRRQEISSPFPSPSTTKINYICME